MRAQYVRDSDLHAFPSFQKNGTVLARLRAYGWATEQELKDECSAPDPAAAVAELCALGFHIDRLQSYRPQPSGKPKWAYIYVMWVKHIASGQIIPTPVLPGTGPVLERWTP